MIQQQVPINQSATRFRLPGQLLLMPALAVIALVSGCDGDGGLGQIVSRSPMVTAVSPVDGAIEVPTDAIVSVDFQQSIDPSTLNAATFAVACPAGTIIAGIISYDAASRRAIFTPTEALPGDVSCSARVGTGIKNDLGVPLASDVSWTFATALDSELVAQGREIFRFDTFGDETQWTCQRASNIPQLWACKIPHPVS